MNFLETELPGVIVVEPDVHRDDRGFLLETWQRDKYAAGGIDVDFVQDNHSKSARRTLRGLHAQRTRPQGKLVRCVEGEIFDVAVDIRRGSPHFGRFVAVTLSAESCRQLYVPPDFAHGFCVLSATAQVEYKCTDFYQPGDELTVLWSDPEVGIPWPVEEPLLSAKDAQGKRLAELGDDALPRFGGSG